MADSLLSATGGNGNGCSDSRTNFLRDLRKYISEGYIIDLSSSLRRDELIECARRAREAALIPQRILNDLWTVQPDIPHETKCRYLMLYIGKAVIAAERLGQNKFPNVIELLSRFLNAEQIKLCLLQSVDNLDERMKPAKVLEVCIGPETIIDESHLNRLYEILNRFNHLWYKIGIALKFSADDINNIEAQCQLDTSKCLLKLLHAWLSKPYSYLKSRTFGTLKEVLSSKLVERTRTVDCIKEMLRSTATPNNNIYHNVGMDDNFLTYTSCDVTVQESSNDTVVVIIEVRLKCQDPKSTDYEWSKDGVILKPSDSLILDSSILSIRIADICAEGKYQCRCILGNRVIESDPIELKVETLLCKYRPRLIARYKNKPEVKQDTWHLVKQKTYTNLAVIGDESARLSEKCYHQTIRGDADDVFSSSKSSIEYQEAFRDIMYGDIVIVVGRPGSGKTTLVHKLSKDWADGQVLGKYKVLFIICLRGFHNNPNVTLQDLIKCYFKKQQDINIICEYIEEHEGLGVCFILDGLDEYQPESEEPNFIFQLIERDVLPCATVIVASRPAAVAMCSKVAKRQVEVLGFFKQEIDKYIESYEFSSDSQMSNLKNYLLHHPSIKYMCYLPIQTAMICFLFDECGDALPITETGLYAEFTKHTILRARHNSKTLKCRVHSLEDLESEEKSILKDICELAYKMTISIKQVATKSSLGDLELRETLGLISVDEKATICGFQNLYSFFHLTFQEFLAAYHISRQTIEEQLAIIQSYGSKEHMYVVFKFYCGLAHFKKDDIRFKTLIEVAEFSTVHTLQCCYESQQPDTCELAYEQRDLKNIIYIGEDFNTPSDFTCLGYMVKNATHNPVRVLEYNCDHAAIDSECTEAFVKAARTARIPKVIWVSIEYEMGDRILKRIASCQSLWQFDVDAYVLFYSIHCNKMPTIKSRAYQNAEILVISYALKCDITCRDCESMHSFSYCTVLSLFNCNLNDERAVLLAEGLQHNSSVETLKLVANDIQDEGAVAIANSIGGCSELCYLDLSLNNISNEGAEALVNSIRSDTDLLLFGNRISNTLIEDLGKEKNSRKLFHTFDLTDGIDEKVFSRLHSLMTESSRLSMIQIIHSLYMKSCGHGFDWITFSTNVLPKFSCIYSISLIDMSIDVVNPLIDHLLWRNVHILNLSHNSLGLEGTAYLCQSLQGISHQILTLNLGHNKIGVEGALAVAEFLQESESLCELDLCGNDIQDTGTKAICESFKNNRKLQRLNLASNSIGAQGCLAIASLLEQHGEAVITLDLSHNQLSDVGAVHLERGLKYSSSLQQLYLNNNHIGHEGMDAVAESLKYSGLKELSLANNCIRDRGLKALARCLKTLSELTLLNLCGNEIGDDDANFLGSVVKHCCKLRQLELKDNLISGSGAVNIAEGVQHCRDIKDLELSDNLIEYSCLESIVHSLKKCTNLQTLYISSSKVRDFRFLRDCEIPIFKDYLPNCYINATVELDKYMEWYPHLF